MSHETEEAAGQGTCMRHSNQGATCDPWTKEGGLSVLRNGCAMLKDGAVVLTKRGKHWGQQDQQLGDLGDTIALSLSEGQRPGQE